jgi:two-component system alkaline phosphatase synthesis response regulator PhoP
MRMPGGERQGRSPPGVWTPTERRRVPEVYMRPPCFLYNFFTIPLYNGGHLKSREDAREMTRRRILVVDDDQKIVELVKLYLEKDGYRVLVAYDGLEALDLARQKRPDLILLDLLLPGMDGLDVCRIIQAESEIPIIMLTAKTTDEDKLRGLELGADDYVTKPFNPREVMARVRAVLRRTDKEAGRGSAEIRFADLLIDRIRHEVWLQGEIVNLTPTEFRLLEVLAGEPGRAFNRLELLDRVFGYDFEGFERTVDVHVKNLRKKIEPDPRQPVYIKTVYGVGYKFGEGPGND